jgi:hypothetical protein
MAAILSQITPTTPGIQKLPDAFLGQTTTTTTRAGENIPRYHDAEKDIVSGHLKDEDVTRLQGRGKGSGGL